MVDTKTCILRAATTMHNACMKTAKAHKCKECQFYVTFGCALNGHPINWADKLKEAKQNKE